MCSKTEESLWEWRPEQESEYKREGGPLDFILSKESMVTVWVEDGIVVMSLRW